MGCCFDSFRNFLTLQTIFDKRISESQNRNKPRLKTAVSTFWNTIFKELGRLHRLVFYFSSFDEDDYIPGQNLKSDLVPVGEVPVGEVPVGKKKVTFFTAEKIVFFRRDGLFQKKNLL